MKTEKPRISNQHSSNTSPPYIVISEMDSSSDDSIKVFVRIRPLGGGSGTHEESNRCVEVTSNSTISLNMKDTRTFTFDSVKGESTSQEEIFGQVGKPVVDNCLKGYNGTIFAYGQTGSGKSYTMTGLTNNDEIIHEKRGIIPRCFESLCSLMNREMSKRGDRLKYIVTCSFLEIYKEGIFDLLDAGSTGLQIREDVKRGVVVRDLTELGVENSQEMCEVLKVGSRNRRVASTNMNRESSRSHAVFTVNIKSIEINGDISNIREARLHMIDLAGSERQKSTNTDESRLKEAGSINKSLSALGNVIMALVDIASGKMRHVAYRDSKLTFLLRDSLGGNTKTSMIANISPAARSFGETLSTLQFASRAKLIKNKATINEDISGDIHALRKEIEQLKQQLVSGSRVTNDSSLPEDARDISKLFIAALESKNQAEIEKQKLADANTKMQELLKKKDQVIQSNKMIIKFRDNAIAAAEKKLKRDVNAPIEEEAVDLADQLSLAKQEVDALKKMCEQHPEVTRFAMKNLELKEQLVRLKDMYPNAPDDNVLLTKKMEYIALLEQRLLKLQAQRHQAIGVGIEVECGMHTPVANRTKSRLIDSPIAFASPRAKHNHQLELQMFKKEKELLSKISNLEASLKAEKTAMKTLVQATQQREIELRSESDSVTKSLQEAEASLKALQLRSSAEIMRLQDEKIKMAKDGSPGKREKNAKLQSEVEALAAELSAVRTSHNEAKRTITQFESSERAARQELRMVTAQLEALQTQSNTETALLEAAVTAAVSKSITAETEADGLREVVKTQSSELDLLSSQLKDTEASASNSEITYNTKLAEAQDEITRVVTEMHRFMADAERETTAREANQNELDSLRIENEYLTEQLDARNRELTESRKEAAAATDIVSQFTGDAGETNTELAHLTTELNEVHSQLTASNEKVKNMEDQNQALRRQMTESSATLQRVMEDTQRYKTEIFEAREELSSRDHEITELRASLNVQAEQMLKDSSALVELESRFAEAEAELEAEAAAHRDQVSEIMSELATTTSKIDSAELAQQEAEDSLLNYKATAAEERKKIQETATKELSSETQKVAVLERELANLRQAVNEQREGESLASENAVTQLVEARAQLDECVRALKDGEIRQAEKQAEIMRLRKEAADLVALEDKVRSAVTEASDLRAELKVERTSRTKVEEEYRQKMETVMAEHNVVCQMLTETAEEHEKQSKKVAGEKASLQSRMTMHEANLDAALEDAEALVDELQRTRELEKTLFAETEELKSKFEQSQEDKLRVEEELAKAERGYADVKREMEKLLGHTNPQQKIQLQLKIKKENLELRTELDKLKCQINTGEVLQSKENVP